MRDIIFTEDEEFFFESGTTVTIDLYQEQNVLRGQGIAGLERGEGKQIVESTVRFNPNACGVVFIPSSEHLLSFDGINGIDRTVSDVYLVSLPFLLSRLPKGSFYVNLQITIQLANAEAIVLQLMPDNIRTAEDDVIYDLSRQVRVQFKHLEPIITASGRGFNYFDWSYKPGFSQQEIECGDKLVYALLQVPRGTAVLEGQLFCEARLNKKRRAFWEQLEVTSDGYPLRWQLSEAQWLRAEPVGTLDASYALLGGVANSTARKAVILTTSEIEYNAVHNMLTDWRKDRHRDGTIYEKGMWFSHDQHWQIAIAEIGDDSSEVAAETERALQYFSPDVMLFLGTANGIKQVQAGDVVVATKAYGYESGREDSEFLAKPAVGQPTYAMKQLVTSVKREYGRQQRDDTAFASSIHVGSIASGSKDLMSPQSPLWKLLDTHYNDSLAIEMQAIGFFQASRQHRSVDVLSLHSIVQLIQPSEHSTGTEPLVARTQAAQCASRFIFALLASFKGTHT